MTARNDLEMAIWRAATYHSDDGTSGYLLAQGHIDKILKAADAYLEAARSHIATAERERIRQIAEKAARDALAQPAEPGSESLTRSTWAKALTWFAMELSEGNPAARATEIAQRAEEIHAEHHSGVIVPSLDSCDEHTRAEYEALVRDLLARTKPTP